MLKNYSIKYRAIVNNYNESRIRKKLFKQMVFTKDSKQYFKG